MTGKGILTKSDGTIREGMFLNGHLKGRGILRQRDGLVYDGYWDWNEGMTQEKRCKTGRQEWPDGRVYEGEWVNDLQSGHGTCTWIDGSKYTGNFQNGQMNDSSG